MHPLRLQYEMFSDANPLMALGRGAGRAGPRATASRSRADNPFVAMQEQRLAADRRRARRLARHAARRSPSGRSWRSTARRRCRPRVGIDPAATQPAAQGGEEPAASASCCRARIAELKSRMPVGGLREAVVRGAALCRHGARRGRRARVRGGPPDPRERAPATLPLAGVQGAGARAVLHAADRRGGRARRDSGDAPARRREHGARRSSSSSEVLSARGDSSADDEARMAEVARAVRRRRRRSAGTILVRHAT